MATLNGITEQLLCQELFCEGLYGIPSLWHTQHCKVQSLTDRPLPHLETPFLGEVPHLSHEVACRLAPCTRVCHANGCAYHHQWDVKLDVPHQMQNHCLQ